MTNLKISTKKSIVGVLFVVPCMLILLVMMLYPLVQTFVFSVSEVTLPNFDLKFTGLDNFVRIFSRQEIRTVVRNTLVWTLGCVVFRLLLGMLTALVMNAGLKGIGVLRILVLIPWTVPSIVSANTWRWILQGDFGVINGTLKAWGLGEYAYSWLSNAGTAMPALLLAATWAGYPFVMMMLLSAMQGLPKEHYEAAMVDGANAVQRYWHITFPGIRPVLFIVLALETISAVNSFDMIYTMTGGGPGGSTEIFGLFVYRLGFNNFDFAGASAASAMLVVVALLLCCAYIPLQARSKRGDT